MIYFIYVLSKLKKSSFIKQNRFVKFKEYFIDLIKFFDWID